MISLVHERVWWDQRSKKLEMLISSHPEVVAMFSIEAKSRPEFVDIRVK